MADSSGGSDGKTKMNGKVICGIGTGGFCVTNFILNLMGKGITITQIINFFNSWPVTLGMMFICIALVIIVYIHQTNKTKRSNNKTDYLIKQRDELEKKQKDLKDQLSEANEKVQELSKEKARLEGKVESLEEEKKKKEELDEQLKELDSENLKLSKEKIQLEVKYKALEEKVNMYEREKGLSKTESENIKQSLNKKGGTGGLTLFSGKNGTNA